ncbi:hypothetical protein [Streptomyces javensis]|uniref:Uncharacterized protein n=1 Tax=Streptomyces javensis TaxID=114698 RepID=A0ABS0R5W7_9ACTN|nr:hypothetical protein [Streptomyces javensis]MBI0312703.1 hypothetical protein [Streptomyces javensis]
MARDIGMEPDAALFRAVIVKSYANGTSHTVYEGPYDSRGSARARVSFWRNHFGRRRNGDSADGHVERCQPVWEKVPDPASRRQASSGGPALTAAPGTSPPDSAAQLILDAVQTRRGMHGRHAADLLAEHGYVEEAERIRVEVRARHGHLSAKQAAALLTAAP